MLHDESLVTTLSSACMHALHPLISSDCVTGRQVGQAKFKWRIQLLLLVQGCGQKLQEW